jgi:hypothetical protein
MRGSQGNMQHALRSTSKSNMYSTPYSTLVGLSNFYFVFFSYCVKSRLGSFAIFNRLIALVFRTQGIDFATNLLQYLRFQYAL